MFLFLFFNWLFTNWFELFVLAMYVTFILFYFIKVMIIYLVHNKRKQNGSN